MSVIQTVIDSFIFCHKYIQSLYPMARDVLEYYSICKKPNKWKQLHYQNTLMITYEEYINNIKYIKIVNTIEKEKENKVVPFEKNPFMYIQIVFDDIQYSIYDEIKCYFVKENVLNRDLVEYIALNKYSINLHEYKNYQIHVFTNDATFKIYTESDVFEY